MAMTFTLEIKKAPTSQGKFPVFIRMTEDRKHKRLRTSVELNRLSDWNPKGAKNQNWVRSSEKNATKWNDALARELEEAKELHREDRQASIQTLATKVRNKESSSSFLAFAKSYAEEMSAQGRSIAKHYESFNRKLESFLASQGKKDVLFSEMNRAFIADFESFLRKENCERDGGEARRLHPNYVRTLLTKLRTLCREAIKAQYISEDNYPFRNYQLKKPMESSKVALDPSEILAIHNLEYPEGSWMWHTKNAFLLSYYCAGIRAGDLLQLRWNNIMDDGARLEYRMDKNGKMRNMVLAQQAQAILSLYRSDAIAQTEYIFPLLDRSAQYAKYLDVEVMPVDLKKQLFSQIYSKNALLNRCLKKIATDAGITKRLTFHISRHTFASLLSDSSVPTKVVQEALAHSSLQTTENYIHSFNNRAVDDAIQKVFSDKESRQEALLRELRKLDKDELSELLSKLDK